MTKKLIGVFVLVAGSVAGCATSPAGWASRGTVFSSSPGTRAIVTGPTTVHAYAGFGGGEIYSTRAATGTDSDCPRIQQDSAAVPLPADKVISVTVPAGEIACLRTQTVRGYELLWHALAQQPTPSLLADGTNPRLR
jgi:hypothetical protein